MPHVQVLGDLREATAEQHAGRERNQVAPEQGRFLAWLVETLGVQSAIEIGVFTGYSSLAIALVRTCRLPSLTPPIQQALRRVPQMQSFCASTAAQTDFQYA